ncbi:MAG: DUF3291 domain-containing protein [Acidimicrobiales bacterium]
MTTWHLAQCNIAVANGPTDSPVMAEFMDALDAINAAADAASGFVWRLADDNGNLTDVRVFDDPDTLINISTWVSIDAFRAYVYGEAHGPYVKRRREWFSKPTDLPVLVMWWVPEGTEPSALEGRRRLELLAANGPGPEAFTFAKRFGPPAT